MLTCKKCGSERAVKSGVIARLGSGDSKVRIAGATSEKAINAPTIK